MTETLWIEFATLGTGALGILIYLAFFDKSDEPDDDDYE